MKHDRNFVDIIFKHYFLNKKWVDTTLRGYTARHISKEVSGRCADGRSASDTDLPMEVWLTVSRKQPRIPFIQHKHVNC